jgi:regulator of sirC expression with transglutaminase-like and TPR domain
MNKSAARQQFIAAIQLEDSSIELDRAALLIAAEEYPSLNVEEYLSRLDELAENSRRRMTDDELSDSLLRAETLANHLFGDDRFTGNSKDYYDARNSFLNDVIDRGRGIPIALSVVFIEVARRLRIQLYGVGLPGHFLVKYSDTANEVFFDPFNGGKILTEDDCRQKVEEMYQGRVPFHPSFLAAFSKKQILSRMLQNLKGVYFNSGDLNKAVAVIERLVLLNPGSMEEIRDRGLVNFALKKYALARPDLEAYLQAIPNAQDQAQVIKALNELRQKQARLN